LRLTLRTGDATIERTMPMPRWSAASTSAFGIQVFLKLTSPPLQAGVPGPSTLDLRKREDEYGARTSLPGSVTDSGTRVPGENGFNLTALKGTAMALSDDLTKLAARTKEAEDRATAARSAAHAQLQQDVQSAQDSMQKNTDQLRQTAEANQGKVAQWWSEVQKSWDDDIASIRRDIDSKKAEHDLHAAQRKADSAEEDAEFAITYAYWAVEEAEYRVLDATLARMNADSLADSPS
jgi:hypothetical protein